MSQNDRNFQSKGKKFGGGGKGRGGAGGGFKSGGRGGFGKKFEGDRGGSRSEGGYKGKSGGFKKPFRERSEGGSDRPYKKREWSSDRPERSGGDRPFKKPFRDRDGGAGGDRPYKKREWSGERSGGDRGGYRTDKSRKTFGDRPERSSGDRPFKKPFRDRDGGAGGDRPYKKREWSSDRPERSGGGEGRGFKSDRPFKKPFRDRDGGGSRDFKGGGDRPFKKREWSSDRPARSEGGDRPFKKKAFGDRDGFKGKGRDGDAEKKPFRGDTHKPYKRNFDRSEFDARPKKSFSDDSGDDEGLGFELDENNEMVETAPGEGRVAAFDTQRKLKADRSFGTPSSAFLYGAHAVNAALQNPRRLMQRLLVTKSGLAHVQEAYDLARNTGIKVPEPQLVEAYDLERLLPRDAVHQGVLLDTQPLEETFLADILIGAGENARIVVLDQVTDPHNVGAILRSAAAFGASAVVVQKLHAPDVTGTLAKSASGAVEHVPLVRETNLTRALEQLKEAGFFCIGLDERGKQTVAEAAGSGGKIALVLGAEGDGLRRLVSETCDTLAKLPTQGAIASLNVSNAAAVALYELVRK